jgi:hypothetical protein
MSDIELPKRTAKDLVHRTVKAGMSAIPFVGGPAAEFFDYFIRSPILERQDEFVLKLALGLDRLQKNQIDIETLPNNQKFVTIVSQAMVISLRNHQKEKLEALQNAILNSAISNDSDIDLELMFLNYIDIFTPSHLEVLDYLNTNEFDLKGGNWSKYINEKIYEALNSIKPKYSDINYFNVIMKDLMDRQLINPMTRNVPEEAFYATVVTNMGKEFLNYITISH